MRIVCKTTNPHDLEIYDDKGNNLFDTIAIKTVDIHMEVGKAIMATLVVYVDELDIEAEGNVV